MIRPSGRAPDQMRQIRFTRHFTRHAEGSVLVEFGDTKVVCTATVEERVPRWLQGRESGWITAEYGMLPRSTGSRMAREAARGGQGGRTMEIQRLIGRSLRAAADLSKLRDLTLTIDCDVLQADGGTCTASISGAYVALVDALRWLEGRGRLKAWPLLGQVASVSVGIYQGVAVLDLDYAEDSKAETDLNLVMSDGDGIIEIQGTAEGTPFSQQQLDEMLTIGRAGIRQIVTAQHQCLETAA